MSLLLIVFLVGGVLFIGLSIPLIQGNVGPNHWYGFRVRQTLNNPSVWYPVNSYSGRWLLGVGVAEIVAATVLYCIPNVDVALYGSIVGGVAVGGLLVGFVQTMRNVHQLTNGKGTAAG